MVGVVNLGRIPIINLQLPIHKSAVEMNVTSHPSSHFCGNRVQQFTCDKGNELYEITRLNAIENKDERPKKI